MKTCLTSLLLLLLAIPTSGFGQQGPDSKLASLLAAAQQAQAKGDYAAAAESYKQAAKIRPNVAELWANLGLMEHEAGNYKDAIQALQEANRLKPSLYVPNLFLGIDYVKVEKPKDAIPLLLKAEKLNHKDAQVPLALGRAYASLGQTSLAVHEFTRAVQLDPKQSPAWFALGITYLDQVETGARKMSTENKNSPYATALFAESLAKQSRYKEARDLYKSILTSDQTPPCMHSELGWVYLKQNDPAEAASEFKAELQSHPECSLAAVGQARILIDAGSFADALSMIEKLWDRDPGFAGESFPMLADGVTGDLVQGFLQFINNQYSSGAFPASLYEPLSAAFKGLPQPERLNTPLHNVSNSSAKTAEELYKSGQYAECAARMHSALTGDSADNLMLLANCSYWTGDYDLTSRASARLLTKATRSPGALYWSIKANERLAFKSLEQFQELEPNSAKDHILYGDIWRQRRQYSNAESEYKKALELSSNDHAALLGLASAYYGDGYNDKTIETVQLALLQNPDDPELNLLMAEALIASYKFSEAEPFLNKSLSAKPQMLSHVHALLGDVYAKTGRPQEAIEQLKRGLESDDDGHVHYLLARLYRDRGDIKDANIALEQMKTIRQQSRKRSAIALEDSNSSAEGGTP